MKKGLDPNDFFETPYQHGEQDIMDFFDLTDAEDAMEHYRNLWENRNLVTDDTTEPEPETTTHDFPEETYFVSRNIIHTDSEEMDSQIIDWEELMEKYERADQSWSEDDETDEIHPPLETKRTEGFLNDMVRSTILQQQCQITFQISHPDSSMPKED